MRGPRRVSLLTDPLPRLCRATQALAPPPLHPTVRAVPRSQVSQRVAYHLAMCDDIGSAAYDARSVAAALVETLALVERERPSYVRLGKMRERWGINPEDCTGGEDYINQLAEARTHGRAACRPS